MKLDEQYTIATMQRRVHTHWQG